MANKLYERFRALFPDYGIVIWEYEQLGNGALKMTCADGSILYFMWYSETKWVFGTEEEITWLLRK